MPSTSTAGGSAPATYWTMFVRRLDLALALIACVLVVLALAIIWVARFSVQRDIYVSALGAQGMPTAQWFQLALVLVSLGGGLVAFTSRSIRSTVPVLGLWPPALSLAVAAAFFLLASQVTCTRGCPIPYGPSFTWPDFVHTSSAVLAFAFACWGMLQLAFSRGRRFVARFSLACCIAVALIAATGGIMAVIGWERGVGSRFELTATTIAIGWLVSLGLACALPSALRTVRPNGLPQGRNRHRRVARAIRSGSSRPGSGARLRRR